MWNSFKHWFKRNFVYDNYLIADKNGIVRIVNYDDFTDEQKKWHEVTKNIKREFTAQELYPIALDNGICHWVIYDDLTSQQKKSVIKKSYDIYKWDNTRHNAMALRKGQVYVDETGILRYS